MAKKHPKDMTFAELVQAAHATPVEDCHLPVRVVAHANVNGGVGFALALAVTSGQGNGYWDVRLEEGFLVIRGQGEQDAQKVYDGLKYAAMDLNDAYMTVQTRMDEEDPNVTVFSASVSVDDVNDTMYGDDSEVVSNTTQDLALRLGLLSQQHGGGVQQ